MIAYLIERAHREIPSSMRNKPWSHVNHGTDLLSSTDQLNAYMCAYGEMHKSKCLSALQNFPYETLPTRFEIIDWGCGQGIGTICMMDCLHEHGILQQLKKVTLIEPSATALQRAKENVSTALQGWNVEIVTKQMYLPSENDSEQNVRSLDLALPSTIHLFSNILDIPSVSLSKTARLICNQAGKHFVVCVGPMNTNSPRIDEFSQYFNNKTVFSDIHEYNFGITPDTCHNFSCKSKAFYFTSTVNTFQSNVIENHYSASGAHDDYDIDALVRNGIVSEDVLKAYKTLSAKLYPKDKIFLCPDIKGDKPDIVIVRDKMGVVILNVFSENLMDYTNDSGTLTKNGVESQNPLTRVTGYKDNLITEHTTKIFKATFTDKKAWYLVRPAVWFTRNSQLDIESTFIYETQHRRPNDSKNILGGVATLSQDDFRNDKVMWKFSMWQRDTFTEEIKHEVLRLLVMQWHQFSDGDSDIVLTTRQRELANSYAGRITRTRGVAGSGKTQILVSSAVKSQLRTGRKVLILTYNITLANYIRHRINKIPADFPWNKFVITNFHKFFNWQARNNDLKLSLNSYNKEEFFNDIKKDLPKYSAIFIDEAQDYEREWFTILYNNFVEEDGEFVVFGDEKQDVYGRKVFGVIPNLGSHTWGRWNELKSSQRHNNAHICELTYEFQKAFFENPDEQEPIERMLAFDSAPLYQSFASNAPASDVVEYILNKIGSDDLDVNNTAVLSPTADYLREVDFAYRTRTGNKTKTTFASKEDYDRLLAEQNGVKNNHFKESIEEIRTNKKAHFSMLKDGLKLSTIFSYKGWEAENIFLIIPRHSQYTAFEESPELIYTGLTRAKSNLYVINMSNAKYHNFFRTHLG